MPIFESSTLLQKQQTFKVSTTENVQAFAARVYAQLPECNPKKMKWIKRKNIMRYTDNDKVIKLNGQKLVLKTLEFSEIMPGLISVTVEYETPGWRPFLFLATVLGFCAGVFPGVFIYFMFREPAEAEVKKVMPALMRLEALTLATPLD